MRAYTFFHHLLAGFFRLIYNVKAEGLENEPLDGAFIVCSNHLANDDVAIIGASLKRPLRFLAKKELFKVPIVHGVVKMLGAYPVDRNSASASVASLKTTVKLLSEGEAVAMFPQGHRMPKQDPRDTEIKNGIGLIAYRSKVRVLPVCIQQKGWKIRPFRKTILKVGKPIEYEELGFEKGGNDEYTVAAKIVFDRICSMIDDDAFKKKPKKRSKK